jgi:hypothetical protein
MGFTEELLERTSGSTALGIGLGVLFLGPVLLPAFGRGLRPLAKSAIKGYLALSERTREVFAETGERLQDLYAEAQSEYASGDGTGELEGRPAARAHASG